MVFKIIPPDIHINGETDVMNNKEKFINDFQANGILTEVFIFCAINQPITKGLLTDKLTEYYRKQFDPGTVYRSLKLLTSLGILHSVTAGEVVLIQSNMRNDMEKEVVERYYAFLDHIPKQFRQNFGGMAYFWVSNGDGVQYLDFCCKLLGFKCEKEEVKDGND